MADIVHLCFSWAAALWSASWQGALVILGVWLLCRLCRRMPGGVASWLWRLVFARLVISLLWPWPIRLAWLPPRTPVPGIASSPAVRGEAPTGVTFRAGSAAPSVPVGSAAWPLMAAAWLAGIGWTVIRAHRGLKAARRVSGLCEPVLDGSVLDLYNRVCAAFGVSRPPDLATVEGEGGPVLLAFGRPCIVVPRQLLRDADPDALRMILAHEVAHFARRDLVWSWLAVAVNGLFFFHPLVWLANREALLAQEMACDDLALQATRAPVAEYGELLVKVAVQQPLLPQPGLATVAVEEPLDSIKRRLDAMAGYAPVTARRSGRWALSAAVIVVPAVVPWQLVPRPAQVPATALAEQAAGNRERRAVTPRQETPSTLTQGGPAPATGRAAPSMDADEPAALDPDTAQTLADLASADAQARGRAARKLASAPPNRFRRRVAAGLVRVLDDPDPFTRQAAVQALAAWAGEAGVPALVRKLDDADFSVRWVALDALGSLKDARAASAVAAHLPSHQDRFKASAALRSIGPAAEPAVRPYLRDRDWVVRSEACSLMRDIGTRASLPDLRRCQSESTSSVSYYAEQAIAAIGGRR